MAMRTPRMSANCFDLVIKNIGLGPAYNVRFEVLEEPDIKDHPKLSKIEFINAGIKYMPQL